MTTTSRSQAIECLEMFLREHGTPEARVAWSMVREDLEARLTSGQAFFFVANYMDKYSVTGRWRSNPYDYFVAWLRSEGKKRLPVPSSE